MTLSGPAGLRGRRLPGCAVLLAVALCTVMAVLLVLQRRPVPQLRSTSASAIAAAGESNQRESRRELLAAAPMLAVPPLDMQSRAEATEPVPMLAVPAPRVVGAAGVPSGFPRTPSGAVAQLAAIESVVMNTMSVRETAAVYRAWALPGGVGAQAWTLTRHVRVFLNAAGMAEELDATVTVAAAPAAGLIKGSDGSDWVLACVLLEVRAIISVEARIGFGHCERMQWQPSAGVQQSVNDRSSTGRWLIGPGSPPARAPSTWPGSELSRQAGWRTWAEEPLERQGR